MSKTDDLIIEAIRSKGDIKDDEYVTEAMVIYVTVNPDDPKRHKFGKLFLGDYMPFHHAVGLIETMRESIYDIDYGEDLGE